MHPHIIDWLRDTEINPDAALATKRWSLAKKFGDKVGRAEAIDLLRAFVCDSPDDATIERLTSGFLAIDQEFPATKNTEVVRVVAGIVMVTKFSGSSYEADAFALGLLAASFQNHRNGLAQPAILTESESYLHQESLKVRPDEFDASAGTAEKKIGAAHRTLRESEGTPDEAARQAAASAYHKSISGAILDAEERLTAKLRHLAEESSIAWWILGEYSDLLGKPVSSVSADQYSLAAASEAAQRTRLLPPPPSIKPVLARALRSCRKPSKAQFNIEHYLGQDISWTSNYLKAINAADCVELVPVTTALRKMVELDDAAAVAKALPRLCPGVPRTASLTPAMMALQFYNELMFVRSLNEL